MANPKFKNVQIFTKIDHLKFLGALKPYCFELMFLNTRSMQTFQTSNHSKKFNLQYWIGVRKTSGTRYKIEGRVPTSI